MELEERLGRLNDILGDAIEAKNTQLIEENTAAYLQALEEYLPILFSQIEKEDIRENIQPILHKIFEAQRSLMGIRVVGGLTIESDGLWEVANDFDNDDPNAYEFLIKKVKNKEYRLK
jgi:hypothetical protein